MTASSAALDVLLAVQHHDLAIDQLRYRRENLTERQAIRALRAEQADVAGAREHASARLHELERAQRRLEDGVESIEAKAAESESRLYGGTVQAPKELQALAAEVESLRGRKRSQEDELLEVMEAIEPVSTELEGLAARGGELARRLEERSAELAAREAEIDGELGEELDARQRLASEVPADLLATYERLRHRLDGVGIARVDAGRCTGCHLSLSAVERDSLRRAAGGEVVRHEECGRLLVP
ncbi:MAG TPA: C4-type zinc ribbon domain-containing protein [Acidimicrobiales bacterium]|nr:C4-type zinc ribbon domain-containing protein [Acidimicrobiales bacterium]